MREVVIGAALLLVACGARSGLDTGEPAPAARPDGGDILATLPCRWSVGVPVVVARSEGSFVLLDGGTVGTRDSVLNRAVVGAFDVRRGRDMWVGGVVTTAGVGELLVPLEGDRPIELLAGRTGFVSRELDSCEILTHDLDFGAGEVTGLGAATPRLDCLFSQTSVDSLEVAVPTGDGRFRVRTLEGFESPETITQRELLTTETRELRRAEVVHQAGRGTFVLSGQADAMFVERHADEAARVGPLPLRSAISVAPDRLRGGMIVLHDPGTGWRLDRFAFEGPLAAQELLDLSGLPAPPIGRVASNETEALVPLADGSMLYVILSSPRVRLVDMEDVPEVEAMEIVIRPDDSAGGLLYVTREPAGQTLSFRPLTCNR